MKVIHEMAEREGFEPSVRFWRTHTFQACSLNRSDTSPGNRLTTQAKTGTARLNYPPRLRNKQSGGMGKCVQTAAQHRHLEAALGEQEGRGAAAAAALAENDIVAFGIEPGCFMPQLI